MRFLRCVSASFALGLLVTAAIALGNGCDRPAGRTLGTAPIRLLVFEQQGGIAGFQDRLVVGYGGEYYLQRGGRVERIGSLGLEKRGQLEGWAEGFAPFTLRLEDNPGGPDNLVRQLVWVGLGKLSANGSQQKEILDWGADLVGELSAVASYRVLRRRLLNSNAPSHAMIR